MKPIIVNNLTKTYGKKTEKVLAVDDVSFDVNPGEIFGLIGPDGAGKTSIFRMLTTVLLPDSGSASIEGFDMVKDYKEIRKILGYMPGRFSLYQDLTIEENLEFFASVFNTTIAENYKLIKNIYIQIEPFKDRRAGKLSGGMKQKLALCCALIHKPKVLFLDEPTTGVDPVSRKEFWEMLRRLKLQGITMVVATPYMDEAALCDRIALMQHGKILSINTPEKISNSYPDLLFEVKAGRTANVLRALENFDQKKNVYAYGEFVHLSVEQSDNFNIESITEYLKKEGFENIEINPIKASIEDSFIRLLSN
ncbi:MULTISPECIES: ABC transporter ATP-binding protein [unclassified Kaistella]|uniref:ABC transporter ATP-binding protein n=1 Tax=unclassified Kaistella TaxID=2762626 RepID=UPI002732AACC|nr:MULTISPECIES: ABC transporter ATP-binding protein [unclassified Kaistella]MDP2453525.1 ABC transporter ATP-binding protein [Kaistella sp. SH11-4b]MDP2456582.1 ABC transporter ATP-binding protein [Kaistella sp. SH40-3]MDP2459338.1 ABC transporter ATP-binding protein [Kaistella sp. SH19-2b]